MIFLQIGLVKQLKIVQTIYLIVDVMIIVLKIVTIATVNVMEILKSMIAGYVQTLKILVNVIVL